MFMNIPIIQPVPSKTMTDTAAFSCRCDSQHFEIRRFEPRSLKCCNKEVELSNNTKLHVQIIAQLTAIGNVSGKIANKTEKYYPPSADLDRTYRFSCRFL